MACGRYDRTQPLIDGRVEPEGVDLTFIPLRPGETFWRMLNHEEFDCLGNVAVVLHHPALGRRHAVHRHSGVSVAGVSPLGGLSARRFKDREAARPQRQAHRRRRLSDDGCGVGARLFAARLRRAARRRHLGDRPAGAHHQAAGGHPRRIHVARDDARGHAGARRDRRAVFGDDSENAGHHGAAAVRRSAQSRARLLRTHAHLPDHAHLRAEDKTLRGKTRGWRSASIAPSAGRATSPITGCTTPTR